MLARQGPSCLDELGDVPRFSLATQRLKHLHVAQTRIPFVSDLSRKHINNPFVSDPLITLEAHQVADRRRERGERSGRGSPQVWDQQSLVDRRQQGKEIRAQTAASVAIQYDSVEWEPAFLRQAREFLFFPLLPREASKRVPIFDRGTGSKPERLRSGSLQADLSLIV
jgi:hypothetical protein